MALLEKHRSIIYAHFVEEIGEEAAQAMLAQFPARELDEPVTKGFVQVQIADVRREMAEFRGEMRAEFADVRGEMRAEFADVRGEMRAEFADVRKDMADLGNHLARRMQVTVGVATGLVAVVQVLTR